MFQFLVGMGTVEVHYVAIEPSRGHKDRCLRMARSNRSVITTLNIKFNFLFSSFLSISRKYPSKQHDEEE